MLPIRSIAPWSDAAPIERQELAGPASGSKQCRISALRFGQGAAEVPLDMAQQERLLVVLSGAVVLDSGAEHVLMRANDAVFLPRGRTHALRNPEVRPAIVLEVCGLLDAAPLASDRASAADLASMLCHIADGSGFGQHQGRLSDKAMRSLPLADRSRGSECLRAFAAFAPPASGMGFHIHPFDQFYFVLEGSLDIGVGLESGTIAPGDLVRFGEAVVHRNANTSADPVLQITINAPEPASGTKASTAVTLEEGAA